LPTKNGSTFSGAPDSWQAAHRALKRLSTFLASSADSGLWTFAESEVSASAVELARMREFVGEPGGGDRAGVLVTATIGGVEGSCDWNCLIAR
jgi:hypothetical protein